MSDDLLEVLKDGVAVLTLNRPDRLNAMSRPMLAGPEEALERLAGDADVGVLILTGAGRAFCAGGDVKAMAEGTEFGEAPLAQKAQELRSRREGLRPRRLLRRFRRQLLPHPAGGDGEGARALLRRRSPRRPGGPPARPGEQGRARFAARGGDPNPRRAPSHGAPGALPPTE